MNELSNINLDDLISTDTNENFNIFNSKLYLEANIPHTKLYI